MSSLAPRSTLAQRLNMSSAQLELIRRICISPEAPDDVLELYLAKCRNLGVDPLDRQIYCIPRRANVKDEATGEWRSEIRWTIQGSIDLFRSIAENSGDYAGQLGPFWSNDGEAWRDTWLDPVPPKVCKIGVLRNSFKEPLWTTGTYDYFCPRDGRGNLAPSAFWKGEKGAHQLAKCVEELALRKAFPRKLRGVYGTEEMTQAPRPANLPPRAPQPEPEPFADAQFDALPPPENVPEPVTDDGGQVSPGDRDRHKSPSVTTAQSRSAMPEEYRRKAGVGAIKKLCNDRGVADETYRELLVDIFGIDRFRDEHDPDLVNPTSKVLKIWELEKAWLAINERTKTPPTREA